MYDNDKPKFLGATQQEHFLNLTSIFISAGFLTGVSETIDDVLGLFPRGAILVGVRCFSLFMCITSLSRRANALSHTSQT